MDAAMKKSLILVLAILVALPTVLDAQGRGRGGRGGGGRPAGGRDGGSTGPKEDTVPTSRPEKPVDLSALSITAKWKDAKTLEITATVKNLSTNEFAGIRTATLKVVGKDGKPESVKDETLPLIEAGKTATITFETTEQKYFEKEMKWTLEISGSDPAIGNDKKTVTIRLPPQPKAA
jgi:hypothetical protein